MKTLECILVLISICACKIGLCHTSVPTGQITPEGRVTSMSENEKFSWFGTDQGVIRINKKSGKTRWITTKNSQLPSDYITSIACAPDGRVWIGTCQGIFFWDNTAYILIDHNNSNLPDDRVTALEYDNSGSLWVGTHGGFLLKTKGFHFTTWNIEQLPFSLDTTSLLNVTTQCVLHGKITSSTHAIAHPLSFGQIITSISADANGDLWVGLFLKGLIKIRRSTWTFYPAKTRDLITDNIRFVHLESDGTYTIGTYEQGCFTFDGSEFSRLQHESAQEKRICSAYRSDQSQVTVYFCDDGCHIYREGKCIEKFTNVAFDTRHFDLGMKRICTSLITPDKKRIRS